MLMEVLSSVFLIGVPIWLLVEEVLHRGRVRKKAGRTAEVCKSVNVKLMADRASRAA